MEGTNVQEVIDVLFNMTIFVFIGTVMPWSSYSDDYLGLSYWRLILMAIFILLFRRLPIVMALFKFMPAIKTTQEGNKFLNLLVFWLLLLLLLLFANKKYKKIILALFTGWFGPMGVS